MEVTVSSSFRARRGKAHTNSKSEGPVVGDGCQGASAKSDRMKVFKSMTTRSGAKLRRSCLPFGRRKQSSKPLLPSPSLSSSSAVGGAGPAAARASALFLRTLSRLSSTSCAHRAARVASRSTRSLYSAPLSERSAAGRKSTRISCSPKTPPWAGSLAARISLPSASSKRATKIGSLRNAKAPLAPRAGSSTGTERPAVRAGSGAKASCRSSCGSSPANS
mmetsp:Transcript_82240/g.145108  ORF Transcript_82240/g.145108 Transcript_82240/m.145108 type:complete len:220 (+) Transcript_82240:156-815(+)